MTSLVIAAICGVSAFGTGVFASAGRLEVSITDSSAQPPGFFVGVSPLRVLDTRPAPFGPIGVASAGALGANATIDLQLAGAGNAIPAGATAAYLNVTLDQDAGLKSFLTVWPTGEPRPNTSANNAEPGLIAANSMLAKLGSNGSVSIYNQQGAVNVVIDLVGYMVPLASVDGPGAQLTSGAGAPANTVGNDGDFYVDTTTGTLYGPKTGGTWPVPPIALGGMQGAASAYNVAPLTLLAPTLAGAPLSFDTAGPADGSVARTNATTFTVADDGLYTVDYHLSFSAALPGTIRVAVNGVPTGPGSTLTLLVTQVSNAVLVTANAGDTIQLMFIPTVAGTSISLGSASILLEQATAN